MAENKGGGNKKVENREEQVWRVESMQQRGPTAVVWYTLPALLCGRVVHFGFVWCVVWVCGTLWFGLNEAPTS